MSGLQGAGLTSKVKGPADGQGQALVAGADMGVLLPFASVQVRGVEESLNEKRRNPHTGFAASQHTQIARFSIT